jgi:plastocyanin
MALATAFVTLVAGCGTSSGGNEREVLVDFSPDDVAVFVARDFPAKVAVLAGQTVAFKQTWTGEPHTVTGGKPMSDALKQGAQWFALFDGYTALAEKNHEMVNPEEPGSATMAEFAAKLKQAKPAVDSKKVLQAWETLRANYPELPDLDDPPSTPFAATNDLIDKLSESAFDPLVFAIDDADNINQNFANPCYLSSGEPPKDTAQACSAAQQRQPAFNGEQSFYNSGVLPYEGPRGNTFRMKIAQTTKPGAYLFYCAMHGPEQRVEIDVVKPGTKVPSAQAVARQARKEAEAVVAPMQRTYRDAIDDGKITFHGNKVSGPFAGLPTDIYAGVNEFVPRMLKAKAGEPVTWKMVGSHTISFDVPAYLPILQFGHNSIRYNPKVRAAAGGAPEVPEQEGDGPQTVDGGTYDGKGFWSSGLIGADPYLEYTLRISKPGTYNYACLVHPRMIGKVVVS